MQYLLTILFFLLALNYSFGQQDKVVVRFIDAVAGTPVGNVRISDKNGGSLSKSDSDGYCTIAWRSLQNINYLLAGHNGYTTDTMSMPPADIIYLHPIPVRLSTTIVRGSKTGRLLRDPDEYVVEYIQAGENIIAAAYSGNNGGKAKLYLLSKEGDVITTCKLPEEPESLYQGCTGSYYCVCRERFYPISVSGTALSLKQPYKIALLRGLQQCDKAIDGNLFYRIADRLNFKVSYGMIAKGDSIFRPLKRLDEQDKSIFTFLHPSIAATSIAEYDDIVSKWSSEEYLEAYRRSLNRKTWDLAAIAHIDMPLFASGDSLLIFDYYKMRILYHSSAGRPLGQSPIQFEWRQSQRFEIIKDEPLNKFYIHRYDDKSSQTLEELDIRTGATISARIAISKPFAEHISVADGAVYFLWQDVHSAGTRQLYIQREGAPSTVSTQ